MFQSVSHLHHFDGALLIRWIYRAYKYLVWYINWTRILLDDCMPLLSPYGSLFYLPRSMHEIQVLFVPPSPPILRFGYCMGFAYYLNTVCFQHLYGPLIMTWLMYNIRGLFDHMNASIHNFNGPPFLAWSMGRICILLDQWVGFAYYLIKV